MGLELEGRSGEKAEVNARGEVLASASISPEITKVARVIGQAYAWNSQDINIDTAGDTLIALRNESPDQDLVIERMILCAGNVATRFEIHKVTVAYTASTGAQGAIIIGVPLGPGGGKALVDCRSDEDGNAQVAANVFMEVSLKATSSIEVKVGMVLGGSEAIAVDQVAASTAGSVIIFGYFVDRN